MDDTSLFGKMVESWRSGQFCDVTIKCRDRKSVKAPSILLANVSTVIGDILDRCRDKVLSSEVDVEVWNCLLTSLFDGNLDSIGKNSVTIGDLQLFADCLDIRQVIEMCKLVTEVEKDTVKFEYFTDGIAKFDLTYDLRRGRKRTKVTTTCQARFTSAHEEQDNNSNEDGRRRSLRKRKSSNAETEAEEETKPRMSSNRPRKRNNVTSKKANRAKNMKPASNSESVRQREDGCHDNDLVQSSNDVTKICFECDESCEAEFVQCRLCFQLVDASSLLHVQAEHSLSSHVVWPVTCKIEDVQAEEENVMIGRAALSGETRVFQCIQCNTTFSDERKYTEHLHTHMRDVFFCSNVSCSDAFTTVQHRDDHVYFCMGGSVLKCNVCHSTLGSEMAHERHNCPGAITPPLTSQNEGKASKPVPFCAERCQAQFRADGARHRCGAGSAWVQVREVGFGHERVRGDHR